MKTLGLPISHKENEKRRAIIPTDIATLSAISNIYVEYGFGEVLGISDEDYKAIGCQVVSREEVLKQDIICDPKVGDADYLDCLSEGQTVFGWIHATQSREITDKIIANKLTAYAWEKMYENGRHVFWFNNELAGEAAVIHAFQCYGMLPYGVNVAIIGNGNTARGAARVLNILGAHVMQYSRYQEALLREEIERYDVIVNCVLWDISRKDHIISRNDLKRMKRNAMIIDVSCDRNGGIETSVPTTIDNPTYIEEGIMHYVVDHTPSIFYKSFSINNSKIIAPYIEKLMNENTDKVLDKCLIIKNGMIIDDDIIRFQKRK